MVDPMYDVTDTCHKRIKVLLSFPCWVLFSSQEITRVSFCLPVRGAVSLLLSQLVMVGDAGVGKSCFLIRASEDFFTDSFITTIGVDFKIISVAFKRKLIKVSPCLHSLGPSPCPPYLLSLRFMTPPLTHLSRSSLIATDLGHCRPRTIQNDNFCVLPWLPRNVSHVRLGKS